VGVSFGFFPIMVPGITSSSSYCGSTRLGFGGVVAICTLELPESHSAFKTTKSRFQRNQKSRLLVCLLYAPTFEIHWLRDPLKPQLPGLQLQPGHLLILPVNILLRLLCLVLRVRVLCLNDFPRPFFVVFLDYSTTIFLSFFDTLPKKALTSLRL